MNAIELIKLVKLSFEAERNSNSHLGLSLFHKDFTVTEMNMGFDGPLFKKEKGQALRDSVAEVYQISDRTYDFITIAADEAKQTVMLEFVEAYTDTQSGKRFRTPQVAIVSVKDGKLWRTRHYLDLRVPYEYPSEEAIKEALG